MRGEVRDTRRGLEGEDREDEGPGDEDALLDADLQHKRQREREVRGGRGGGAG